MAGGASRDEEALIDEAAWAAARAYRHASHTAVEETGRLRWLVTGTPYEGLNGVFWAAGEDPEVVGAALRPFQQAEVPMLWHVGPTSAASLNRRLRDAGLSVHSEDAGMLAPLARSEPRPAPQQAERLTPPSGPYQPPPSVPQSAWPPQALPSDLEIRQVGTVTELRAWVDIWARPSRPLLSERLVALRSPVAFGLRPRTAHLLGVLHGEPVACAAVWVGRVARRRQRAPVAWLEHVATLPTARRRGIGAALTQACLQVARRRGARRAALTASPAAASMYRRQGFRKVSVVNRYLWTPRR